MKHRVYVAITFRTRK